MCALKIVHLIFRQPIAASTTMPRQLLIFLCCIITAGAAFAQDSATENHFIKDAETKAVDAYYQYTGKRARLYNGVEHLGYFYTIKGNAYYLTDAWQKGSVLYDGLFYDNVSMMYDIYKDEVVILHFNGYRLTLLSEKVKSFTLPAHRFVRMVYDSLAAARTTLPTGFYEYVYEGKTNAYAKRIKILDEKLTDVVEQEFLVANNYFIYNNGLYHSCSTLRGLRNALQDKSKEVRRYLRKNKIKFKENPEYAIVAAVKYYDTLK